MSKRDFRRFGSPYDPMYSGGGKIEKPQDQHKLRGCGDPNCPMCNPETASQGAGRMSSERENPRAIYGGFDFSALEQRVYAALRNTDPEAARFMAYGGPVGGSSDRPAGPPASYQRARKDVEQWIVPAPEQAFDDIVGNEEALALLKDAISAPVLHKDLYAAYQMRAPKGALLFGPPGCGKTMFARAAAKAMKVLYGEASEFISVPGASIQSPYVGVTEGYIRAIFAFAREYRAFHGHPLLVFIDEADALLPDRTGRTRRVASWEESQVATFLAEMDGMQDSGAFVLLATNRPEAIDEAVLRDGRCDFKVRVKRPTKDAVESILKKTLEKCPKLKEPLDTLVFVAVEAICDPALVIHPFTALEFRAGQQVRRLSGKNFTMEHIVSGAMAASVATRATRHAFSRDKALGVVSGITTNDVLLAVNDLFAENRGLDHAFALDEFLAEYAEEVKASEKTPQAKMN